MLVLRIWHSAACAELVITGPVLAAVKSHLLRRAAILGHDAEADPRLHLLIDGATIPGETKGNTIRFNLPAGTQTTRLVSRIAASAEMFGESEDHRRLGVAIAEIRLDGATSEPIGEGWHAPDAAGLHWTDGSATLHCDGARCLELTLAPILRYWPERRETIAARA